jgi:hypothetical protein
LSDYTSDYAKSLDRFTFAGTNNELVTMTKTVPMSLGRYKYHLKLHNRFAPLEEIMEPIDECIDTFNPLPATFKAKSEHIGDKMH